MAAKPDSKEKEAPAAPAGDKAAAPAEAAAPAKKGGGLVKTWLPVLVAIIVAPGASFAVAQFVLLPKLQAQLAAAADPAAEAHGPAEKKKPAEGGEKKKEKGKGGKEGEGAGSGDTYEFANVVVNLSGTMGTRYLKTSFVVTGAKPDTIKEAFEENKARLTDVTLGVLSSLSLSDLEEPGAKNVLREKLVTAYNQALNGRVAEQVYFSDFVVQ
ncbi:MAG: flagellar basal body-associated FliL family protein [Oleiharenicola lentus]